MEANLEIKNATVEGNKIKDIEFYGDWEVDTGEREVIYREVYKDTYYLGRDVLPYHTVQADKITGGYHYYGFKCGLDTDTDETNPFEYAVRAKVTGGRGSLAQVIHNGDFVGITNNGSINRARMFFFTPDLKKIVGFTKIYF